MNLSVVNSQQTGDNNVNEKQNKNFLNIFLFTFWAYREI